MSRFNIPNLDPLYNEVVEFVKENQGEKGYIDCQPALKNDIIYAIMYSGDMGCGYEYYVYGVRVRDNELEVRLEPINDTYTVKYEEEDFTEDDPYNPWESVRCGDVYYIPTLFNIAECIEEYA